MNPLELDVNKTTTFLLPMLFPDSTHDEIFSNYVKQAYIGLLDEEKDEDKYNIILEFDEDNIGPDSIDDFTNNLQPQGEFFYTHDNILAYRVLKDTIPDYEAFLKGKYSTFTNGLKVTILDFWKEKEGSLLFGVLFNDRGIVDNFTPYLNREITHELEEIKNESWPPPNLFVDEIYV